MINDKNLEVILGEYRTKLGYPIEVISIANNKLWVKFEDKKVVAWPMKEINNLVRVR